MTYRNGNRNARNIYRAGPGGEQHIGCAFTEDDAVTGLHAQPVGAILLNDRRGIGHVLWRLRHTAGYSLDGLAARLHVSRSGVHRREAIGFMPASALIEHLDALGYDLVALPRIHDIRRAA